MHKLGAINCTFGFALLEWFTSQCGMERVYDMVEMCYWKSLNSDPVTCGTLFSEL